MNRVTRFSSAAMGMLLLAGLAYYQGHEDPTSGEEGSLVGTAVTQQPATQDVDCENTEGLSEQDRNYCASDKHLSKND